MKKLFSKFQSGKGVKVKDRKEDETEAQIGESSLASCASGFEIPLIQADDDPLPPAPIVLLAESQGESKDETAGIGESRAAAVKNLSPSHSLDRNSRSHPQEGTVQEGSKTKMAAEPAHSEPKRKFPKEKHLSISPAVDEDDDDEMSESLDAIMKRRGSGRRKSMMRPSPKRGTSPLGSEFDFGGRRSSTMTSVSCEETQISIEEPAMTEEQMFENIKLHKELIDSVKKQPWKMKKRLKIVRKAKAYVRKHEGELEQRLAQSKNTKDVMARYSLIFFRYWERFRRQAANLAKSMIPWEMRIKMIESHFGSAVASYFIFLRWVFWINIVMSILISCFVIVPEVLAADRESAGDRKELLPDEKAKAFNLQTLWDFEGFLRYSPIFYGYYTSKDKTRQGYRIPFAYFMTLLGVYGYSFAAILQRMAENTRQSKSADKDDDCTFTWKLFTSWDYMIGNSETADNKVASILMGFKENILEEREKAKEETSWKVWALRVLANLLVLILLVSSAYAVVLVVERSREKEAEESWWRQNESTVIISLISILYPNLFDLIGMMENNHPRTQLQLQLARIMVLYLLNLYTLIFSLFSKVEDMSAALKTFKPNTTIAPAISSTMITTSISGTTAINTLPSLFGDSLFPNFSNDSSSPFFNMSSDTPQMQMPTAILAEIMSMFNLSTYYHRLSSFNQTCLFVQVNCETKDYVLINDTQLYVTTSDPEVDYNGNFSYMYNLSALPLVMLPRKIYTKFFSVVGKTDVSGIFPTSSMSLTTEFPKRKGKKQQKNRKRTSAPNSVTSDYDVARTTRALKEMASGLTYETGDWWPGMATSTQWNFTTEFPSTIEPEEEDLSGFHQLAPGFCHILRCADTSIVTSTSVYDEPKSISPTHRTSGNMTIDTFETGVTGLHGFNNTVRDQLRKLCWETMFGQDIVKLTVMDLVMTVISILITDFLRALIVRVMNHCCCWDLEKQFPGYGDFKIAENILHLVNNQGMIWMGMFFAPGIPGINMIKIVAIMYIRSWAVLTCNIPHETVFKASNSSNFYYILLLTMLFLCTLPVGYAIVWLDPSWHCGPFSGYPKIYRIFTSSLESILPDIIIRGLGYAASPGIIIPLLVLLILIIYYLNSVANSLREANQDLKDQLRRERTEERRKVFQMADSRHEAANSKWTVTKKILPVVPNKVKMLQLATQQLKEQFKIQELKSIKKHAESKKNGSKVKDEKEAELTIENVKPSQIKASKESLVVGIHQTKKTESEIKEKEEETPKIVKKSKEKSEPEGEESGEAK